jgi:outer membrane protein OmpA-like peptidoglycan-associated protein
MKDIIPGIILLALSVVAVSSPVSGEDCNKAEEYVTQATNPGNVQNPILILLEKEGLLKKAVTFCPSNAKAHNNLGDIYEKQGRFEEAVKEYEKTIELVPQAPYPYLGLGDIYFKTNRPQLALEYYEKGLIYAPDDSITQKRLASIKDMKKSGVIEADTIRSILSAPLSSTRGVGEVVSITFGDGLIPFDFNKSDIREDAKPQLNEIGKALQNILASQKGISIEYKEVLTFNITGHTDARGTDEYNLILSDKRAEAVKGYLIKHFNIPVEALVSQGYGKRVPLCEIGNSEACYAMNRRVEIVKRPSLQGQTRSLSFRDSGNEPDLKIDMGFFYQKSGDKKVKALDESDTLKSRADKYFIFFRPLQDCYVHIIQEDQTGKIEVVYPRMKGDDHVSKNKDYWVPGFGNALTLDDTKGDEKLYLITTSWPIETDIDGLNKDDVIRNAVRGLSTRSIKVVRPSTMPDSIHPEDIQYKPERINTLLTRVEGKGGWVKIVKFNHQ